MSYLDKISCSADVKRLNLTQLNELCSEIRERLVDVISTNGGHLSSNLGVVELTVAIHKVFDISENNDVVVFDVGHQSYTHKLLTGRNAVFETLRHKGGISGFTKPNESPCDSSISGHASVSLSTALGIARAKKLRNEPGKVICVIGDGAFVGGAVYEAMNNISRVYDNLIVVLNDNSMSISKNKSSLSKYLMHLRVKRSYTVVKDNTRKVLNHIPLLGKPVIKLLTLTKERFRREMYKSGTIFEEFGFNYVGVADGHDLRTLVDLFNNCKTIDDPVLLHIVTQKGKGYTPAEDNPGLYHGVSGFDIDKVNSEITLDNSFSNCFGFLLAAAGTDKRVCAITAAMKYATGLFAFARAYPERFFDVGICEEHAVIFASGLAHEGMKPVVAIYSTFLQRSYDQIFHDVMLNNADVLFAIDRAGLVGNDGETHQGIFDAAYLSQFSMPIASPSNFTELEIWFKKLLALDGPAAIRYPRGGENKGFIPSTDAPFDLFSGDSRSDSLIVTYGRMIYSVNDAADIIEKEGFQRPDVLKLNLISPIDRDAVRAAAGYRKILFVEEGIRCGGIAEHMLCAVAENGAEAQMRIQAIESFRVGHMTVDEQFSMLGFTPRGIAGRFIKEFYEKQN